MKGNGIYLKLLFIAMVVFGVLWLHFFIASDKLGDDILNTYALLIVVLALYVKDKNGIERKNLKDYIDITTVIVSIAITFELVWVKVYNKGEPFDIVKAIEIILCAWILIGTFLLNGKEKEKLIK